MQVDEIVERASARRYAYGAFQRLMGDEPTADVLAALDLGVLSMAFEVAGALPACQSALDELCGQVDAARASADLSQLANEYARIFVGPAALPAPPWESVYADGKRLVMTATTLSVRESYRACGYQAQRYLHVPDDHLAIELDFLAALAQDTLDACTAGDQDKARSLFDASTAFTAGHLAQWTTPFARDLRDHGISPFYTAAAEALAAFAAADCAL